MRLGHGRPPFNFKNQLVGDHKLTTIAQRRQAQKIAAFNASKNGEAEAPEAFTIDTAFNTEANVLKACNLQQVRLNDDLKRLGKLKSTDAKADLKRKLISEYQPFLDRYMASAFHVDNEVITELMVWYFDIREINTAMHIAAFAVLNKLPMPARIKSSLETFITDQVLVWADSEHDLGHSIEPYFNEVLDQLTANAWDVPDKLKAKVYKLHAQVISDEDPHTAVRFYQQAEALYKSIGVKTAKNKLIEEIERAENDNAQ
jgi:hypothetical protein